MNIRRVVTIILSLSVLFGAVTHAGSKILESDTKIIQHNQSNGGNGVDPIKLKAPKTPNNSCAVFKKAKVQYIKRRFGKVTIVKKPKLQCNPKKEQCNLGVSWNHSPTGRLDYKVKVTWSLKPC